MIKIHSKIEPKRNDPFSKSKRAIQSKKSSAEHILSLQKSIGNQAVQKMVGYGKLNKKTSASKLQEIKTRPDGQEDRVIQKQPEEEEEEPVCEARTQMKLSVGDPADVYEQEAERVAEQVSNNRILSWGNNQDLISSLNVSKLLGLVEIQGMKISHRDNNDARRLRISMENGSNKETIVPSSLENRILQSKGKGNALPKSIKNTLEFQTGYDFSNVRVKTDSESAELNRSLGARAFTNGSDIWLGRNESVNDIKLMAHELTHVVQQGAVKRISPERESIFSKIRSKSKVMGYLQALIKGGNHDSSVYRKDILQFKKDNSPDKISKLQQQILESPGSSSIGLKENSQTLRGCIPGCTPSGGTPCACHVKSGPTYTPSGTIPVTRSGGRKSASFSMAAEFHNNTSNGKCPRCCQVRQYIKWDEAYHLWRGGPPHSGFPSSATFDTWYEDRDSSDNRYGHRSGSHSDPIAGCGDEYLTGTTRDMANGNKYCGKDAPGSGATSGKYNFQMKVIDTCNGNAEKASSSVITINW